MIQKIVIFGNSYVRLLLIFLSGFVFKFMVSPLSTESPFLTALTISSLLLLARATDMEERDFLKEIDLMKSIGFHKNIINMIGVSTMMKPLFLVLEYMCHGDLLHYLRKKRGDVRFPRILNCY